MPGNSEAITQPALMTTRQASFTVNSHLYFVFLFTMHPPIWRCNPNCCQEK